MLGVDQPDPTGLVVEPGGDARQLVGQLAGRWARSAAVVPTIAVSPAGAQAAWRRPQLGADPSRPGAVGASGERRAASARPADRRGSSARGRVADLDHDAARIRPARRAGVGGAGRWARAAARSRTSAASSKRCSAARARIRRSSGSSRRSGSRRSPTTAWSTTAPVALGGDRCRRTGTRPRRAGPACTARTAGVAPGCRRAASQRHGGLDGLGHPPGLRRSTAAARGRAHRRRAAARTTDRRGKASPSVSLRYA